MILYRFCSRWEADMVFEGHTLVNEKDHYAGGSGGSISKGFCFTPDPPEVAWQYLKGVVLPEVVVEYDIADASLVHSLGRYSGEKTVDEDGVMTAEPVLRREYCMTSLNNRMARQLRIWPVAKFASRLEIAGAKEVWEICNPDRGRHVKVLDYAS